MVQRLLRILSCFLFALLFTLPNSYGQQRTPYRNLLTAINTAVYDTISGVDLDVNHSSPSAQHGNVYVSVIVQGGSGNPYVFEVQYVPDPGFIGVDSFVLEYRYASTFPYLIFRGFRVSVMPSLVTAKTDFATVVTGTPVTIDVLANDSGAWGPLSVTDLPLINNGTATITNNQVVFTPQTGFLGVAHINYKVCDALNTCRTASIHIGVNSGLPNTDSLLIFTNKNQSVSVPLTYEGYTVFQAPANGIVSLNDGRSFQYTPSTGFYGSDQFILKTTANGVDFFKTFHVKVFNVSNPNMMAMDDVRFTPKNQAITFNVRDNDIGNLLVRNWSVPSNFPGTISGTNGVGNVTFTPNPGFSGVATFFYKIGNSSAPALEVATVTIVVDNLAPPANVLRHLPTPKETPLVLRYDIPYPDFSFATVNAPLHGSVTYYPGFTVQVINGQSVSGNNMVVYTPEADYTGDDDFVLIYCAPNGECQPTKIDVDVVEIDASNPPFCVADCAWPGDANADGITNNKDLLPLGYLMGQEGDARIDANSVWYGQYSNNWNDPYSGFRHDLKHGDTDGSSIIDSDDINVIDENYNKIHALLPKTFELGKGLPFFLNLLTQNPGIGDLVQVEVLLGNDYFPAIDVYGYTFEATLGQGVVDSAFKMTFLDNSWLNLNSPSIHLAKRPYQGRFEMAFSRTNGLPASGAGVVGVFEFIIIDIIEGGGQNNRPTITVNPTIMLSDGSTSIGDPITLELPIKAIGRSVNMQAGNVEDLKVYPSPARDILFATWDGLGSIEAASLMDMTGKLQLEQNGNQDNQLSFDVSGLSNGMYVLTVKTSTGVVAKKVQVLR